MYRATATTCLAPRPFLPPLRPDEFFPNAKIRIPSIDCNLLRGNRYSQPRGADWAGAPSLSRLCLMAAFEPILTSDYRNRGRIHGQQSQERPGTYPQWELRRPQEEPCELCPVGPRCDAIKRTWQRARTLRTAGKEGVSFSPGFFFFPCCSGPVDLHAIQTTAAPAPNGSRRAQARGNVQF